MAIFCSNCGTASIEGASFCSSCSRPLGAPASGAAPTFNGAPVFVPAAQNASNTFSTISIILGAISFIFLPPLFGTVSIILAAIAKSKKESRATIALTVGILGLVMGMIIGAIIGYLSASA